MNKRTWIFLAGVCIAISSCGKKTEEAAKLTPDQELQLVDSAANETNARIDSLGRSIDELTNEIDSLLNEPK